MDVPATDVVELVPETIESKKDGSLSFDCNLSDAEVVCKIAEEFIPGLASACVDNTTGDIFRTPGSVAVEIRTEMIEYLTKRSETFVAESVILVNPKEEVSDNPYDIISDFVDDFASTKRNLFSRVSGWLLSEKREEKIDDFVQEMEISGFWSMDRREAIAQILIKNVDFKNEFHCNMKFNSEKELHEHVNHCSFRSMICENEGCDAKFSASHFEEHDSVCPFKIIPCEQKCPESLMRREMDRHCITVCPMKLTNCPFYPVGCQSSVPQCMIPQHRQDELDSHLLYILQKIHKEKPLKTLKRRAKQLKETYFDDLVEAPDVRSLTFAVRDLELELGPFRDIVNEVGENETASGKGKINEDGETNEKGKLYEELEINDKGKVDKKGKINEQGKTDEQGKVDGGGINGEGRVNKEVKINGGKVSEEMKMIDEGRKIDEAGKVSEEMKTIDEGRETDEAGKVSEEMKIIDEGKKSNEAGKVSEEMKIIDEGMKTNEAGKVSEEMNIIDEGRKTNEAGKVSEEMNIIDEGRKTNEAGKVNEEGKVINEGQVNEEGKMNDHRNSNEEEGETNVAGKDNKEMKINGEKVNKEAKMDDQEKAIEDGEICEEVKISGGNITEEEKTDEAGKVNKGQVNEEGKVCEERKINDVGKVKGGEIDE